MLLVASKEGRKLSTSASVDGFQKIIQHPSQLIILRKEMLMRSIVDMPAVVEKIKMHCRFVTG
jgi:hypothetical protein